MTPLERVAAYLEAHEYAVGWLHENPERGVVAFISPCELDLGFNGRPVLGRVLFTRQEMDRLRTGWDETLVLQRVNEAELRLEAELVS